METGGGEFGPQPGGGGGGGRGGATGTVLSSERDFLSKF